MKFKSVLGLASAAVLASVLLACPLFEEEEDDDEIDLSYRAKMRTFVAEIGAYARAANSSFLVIPQNGHELFTLSPGDPEGEIADDYLAAIDGIGREDLFYGYDDDDEATPAGIREDMIRFLDLGEAAGVQALVTDYCSTPAKMDDSYASSAAKSYASFAADRRELDNIPSNPAPIHALNAADVSDLAGVKNFLYLINPGEYASADAMVAAIGPTNYDLILIDLFHEETPLSASQVQALKTKANGGARLVIAYMSIGEAESYRWYWNPAWESAPPAWLEEENPDWEGNFIVRYWDPAWKAIIYGSADAYLDKILAAGFDGVYLDIIEAYEYFE